MEIRDGEAENDRQPHDLSLNRENIGPFSQLQNSS
jgi:hypothetical protein